MADLRPKIEAALKAFVGHASLRDCATALLDTLGYHSDRTVPVEGSKPEAFLEMIRGGASGERFNRKKALIKDWKSADLLFQLTDKEISGEATLFQESINAGLLKSYLFFAIELTGEHFAKGGYYARGKLTGIARQINRVFPMPVMVFIRHQAGNRPVLSIAVINPE